LGDIDVLILCGGRGERLRTVLQGKPKPLVQIGEKVFLDILIDRVVGFGFKRIILSVGYQKEQIIEHFDRNKFYCLEFSEEEMALGTGGAVNAAKPLIRSESFFVMNGDSMCDVDYARFYRFHLAKRAMLSMVLAKSVTEQDQDYGTVGLDDTCDRITSFSEKVAVAKSSLISAGIYLMRSNIFCHMPGQTCFSLEYDLFPRILDERCYGFLCESELIDIGTPERYEKAVRLLSKST